MKIFQRESSGIIESVLDISVRINVSSEVNKSVGGFHAHSFQTALSGFRSKHTHLSD